MILWDRSRSDEILIKRRLLIITKARSTLATMSKQRSTLLKGTKFQRKTRSTLLPFLATKSNVASTLLLVWTGLNGSFRLHENFGCRRRLRIVFVSFVFCVLLSTTTTTKIFVATKTSVNYRLKSGDKMDVS